MTPLSALIRRLWADLLALRVMRAHVVAPDPSVPEADHSVRVDILTERERLRRLREEEWKAAAWCFQRGLHSTAAAYAIAASSAKGKGVVVEVDA